MSVIQRMITALVPRRWAESMETESRAWKVRCQCGHSKSVWDLGGIRWKAKGNPRKYGLCSHCGERSWLRLEREPV